MKESNEEILKDFLITTTILYTRVRVTECRYNTSRIYTHFDKDKLKGTMDIF